jgi:hypothetical protein
MIHYR